MRVDDIALVLARYGTLRASLDFDDGDGVEIIITINDDESQLFELSEDLQRVIDLDQIRMFEERYGVPADQLVTFLKKEDR